MNIWTINPHLPAKAGRARITYGNPAEVGAPSRKYEEILLPAHPRAEFYSLKGGDQFLFAMPDPSLEGLQREGKNKIVFFGGTDEEPFLARLNPEVFTEFKEGGEDRFFGALKPNPIKTMEKAFRKTARRQGDFFAIKIPFTWKVLQSMCALNTSRPAPSPHELTNSSINGTRHLFSGLDFTLQLPYLGLIHVVEGTIRAPDHDDLVLDGVFALEQAANLFDPRNTD